MSLLKYVYVLDIMEWRLYVLIFGTVVVVVMGIHALGTLGYYMFMNNIMGTLKPCCIVCYFGWCMQRLCKFWRGKKVSGVLTFC